MFFLAKLIYNEYIRPYFLSRVVSTIFASDPPKGQLFLPLDITYYATFALMMYLEMKHTLCWIVPYRTP